MGGVSLFLWSRRAWEFGLKPNSSGCLPTVLIMEFGRQGQHMLFSSEGTLCVAVDGDDPFGPRHLELEVCVVWDGIKASECCTAEQGVIATAERYDVEDQVLAMEVIGRAEHHFQGHRARAAGLDSWDHSFKGSVAGFDP